VFFSPSGKRRPEKKNNNPKGKNSIFQLMDEGRIVAFGRVPVPVPGAGVGKDQDWYSRMGMRIKTGPGTPRSSSTSAQQPIKGMT